MKRNTGTPIFASAKPRTPDPPPYYKVVKRSNRDIYKDRLFSMNMFTTRRNIKYGTSLEYIKDEWIQPKIKYSKLFIMDSVENCLKMLKNAVGDKSCYPNLEIWTCDTKFVSAQPSMQEADTLWYETPDLNQYWRNGQHFANSVPTPPGTYSAHEVMLKEQVLAGDELLTKLIERGIF